MTFIITLISLIIERFFHWSQLRHWRWFDGYQQMLQKRFEKMSAPALLVILILPIVIVVGLVNYLLSGWGYGIFKLLFGILVLTYCLGPKNLWMELYACLTELKTDPKKAIERVQTAFAILPQDNSQAFHQAFTRAIFVEAQHRIFSVIFWFMVLGPIGAVLYRATALCAQQDGETAKYAHQAQEWLDWLPVRVVTFLFALGGHFSQVLPRWKQGVQTGVEANHTVLTECGMAALDAATTNELSEDGDAEKEVIELIDRVLVMSLVILAVVVLVL